MKCCLVAHLNDLSGANKSLIDLAKGLAVSNNVTVVVPRKGPLYDELTKYNLDTVIIPSGAWVYKKDESIIKKIVKVIGNQFAELRFRQFYRREKFDIVHYNSYIYGVGAYSLQRLGMPYTWHIRELPEENFNLTFFDKRKSLDIISSAKSIITISNFMRESLPDIFQSKIQVIYNGVSLSERKDYIRNIDKIDDVVIIGAIAEDKGQIDAIRAMKYLHTIGVKLKLYIVGGITDELYYRQLCEEIPSYLKDEVVFIGYKKDVSEFRKQNHLVLICSKAEAFGRVTIEAMASGQIVVGANTGATPEIIQDGYNGYLYKQGDNIDLAQKILSAMQSNKLEYISNNAYMTIKKRFTIEETVHKVENVLNEAIQKDMIL